MIVMKLGRGTRAVFILEGSIFKISSVLVVFSGTYICLFLRQNDVDSVLQDREHSFPQLINIHCVFPFFDIELFIASGH